METIYIVEKGVYDDSVIFLATTNLEEAIREYVIKEDLFYDEGHHIAEWKSGKKVFDFWKSEGGKENFEEVLREYLEERNKRIDENL